MLKETNAFTHEDEVLYGALLRIADLLPKPEKMWCQVVGRGGIAFSAKHLSTAEKARLLLKSEFPEELRMSMMRSFSRDLKSLIRKLSPVR